MYKLSNYPRRHIIILFVSIIICGCCAAQKNIDTTDLTKTIIVSKKKKDATDNPDDTLNKKDNRPRIASLRSAIFPGLGQIYNKKYWKLPIIYGALGGTAAVYFYNHGNYKDLKLAYRAKYNARVFKDSSEYSKIKPNLLPLSEESLRFNRDQFRRNMDYSVLFFAIIWGLNVMDAAVDAHLKSFDISPDLSLSIKPGYSDMANTKGVSFVLRIGK